MSTEVAEIERREFATAERGETSMSLLGAGPSGDTLWGAMSASNAHSAGPLPVLPLRFELTDGRECVLRCITEEDAEQFCEILPQTHRETDLLNYFPGEFSKTIEEEKEFIRDHNAKPCSIGVAAEVDGCIVGFGGAAALELKRYAHHAELGLAVLKDYWGLGIGRRIMECLLDWGRAWGLRKMYLKTFADNHRAMALYGSLGFVEEARLKADVLRGDGSYGDTVIMSTFYVPQPE